MPWSDAEHDAVAGAHAELMSLVNEPSVRGIAGRFRAGVIGLRQFVGELEAVPSVALALKALNAVAGTAVGAAVTASGPWGVILGPFAGAGAVFLLAAIENAIALPPAVVAPVAPASGPVTSPSP